MVRKALLLFMALVLSGCASVSSYQTGRVLPHKSVRVLVAAGYFLNPFPDNPTLGPATITEARFPIGELLVRTGIGDVWEVGAKLTLPMTIGGDGKYEIYSSEHFATSIGLGMQFTAITAGTSQSDTLLRNKLLDTYIPWYLSYDFGTDFAIYMVPKALYRNDLNSIGGNALLLGSSLGVRIGDRWGVFLEASYFRNTTTSDNIFQVGIAAYLGSAGAFPKALRPKPVPWANTGSVVVGLYRNRKFVAVTHRKDGRWDEGDRVCIVRKKQPIGCGKIVGSGQWAHLKLTTVVTRIRRGDRVAWDL